MINEHIREFAGRRPVVEWEPGVKLNDPARALYRIGIEYDAAEPWHEKFADFIKSEGSENVSGLVIGPWGDIAPGASSSEVVESLVAARDWLRKLNTLFFGDILSEESEISWIKHCDMTPLFKAYPGLEHLCIRGGDGLSFDPPRCEKLKTFIIQSGGLPKEVVEAVGAADMPSLEHLELWLGEPNYGGDSNAENLKGLLSGERFPRLQYLGLKNSEIQDEVAIAVANSPLMKRIATLDLSMGTLSDVGAKALAASKGHSVRFLDIHHHYVTPDSVAQLKKVFAGVNADGAETPDVYKGEEMRYISVGE